MNALAFLSLIGLLALATAVQDEEYPLGEIIDGAGGEPGGTGGESGGDRAPPPFMEYSRCYDPQMGEDVDCLVDGCIEIEVAAEGVGRKEMCVCGPYHKGTGCASDLSDLNSQNTQLGFNPLDFLDNPDESPPMDGFVPNGQWSPDQENFAFEYKKRNLLGVYLVQNIDQCKGLCEEFNPKELAYDACGSIVYHEDDGANGLVKVCETVAAKPIRLCEKWLKPKDGWTVSFLAPRTLRHGCN